MSRLIADEIQERLNDSVFVGTPSGGFVLLDGDFDAVALRQVLAMLEDADDDE